MTSGASPATGNLIQLMAAFAAPAAGVTSPPGTPGSTSPTAYLAASH